MAIFMVLTMIHCGGSSQQAKPTPAPAKRSAAKKPRGTKKVNQPRMRKALTHLQNAKRLLNNKKPAKARNQLNQAKAKLKKASHNKAGHRVKALKQIQNALKSLRGKKRFKKAKRHTQKAINQVRKGMKAGNKNRRRRKG